MKSSVLAVYLFQPVIPLLNGMTGFLTDIYISKSSYFRFTPPFFNLLKCIQLYLLYLNRYNKGKRRRIGVFALEKKVVSAKDIAKIANVSQSTVSRVFTPGASVAENTRKKILKIAEEYNYRPNALARGLTKNKTNMIGLAMKKMQSPFYHEVLATFTQKLQDKGYSVLLAYTENEEFEEEEMNSFLEYNVDGVIVLGAHLSPTATKKLQQNDIPVTLFNCEDRQMRCHSVLSDSDYAATMIAKYVHEQGYRDVVCFTGTDSGHKGRLARFIHYFQTKQVHLRVLKGEGTHEKAFDLTTRLLDAGNRPDVIVGSNDMMACGALDALKAKGIAIPDETAVIGFDNIHLASWPNYMLSTWEEPIDQMVDAAVHLIDRERKSDRVSIKLKGQLIHRHTTK